MTRQSRKMKNNKDLCERVHFKTRLLQRYGIRCNRHKYREVLEQLNNDTFLLLQSNTKEIHEVTIDNQQVWIVFDTMRYELITALDYECELRLTNAEVDDGDEETKQLLDAAYRRHREILREKEQESRNAGTD